MHRDSSSLCIYHTIQLVYQKNQAGRVNTIDGMYGNELFINRRNWKFKIVTWIKLYGLITLSTIKMYFICTGNLKCAKNRKRMQVDDNSRVPADVILPADVICSILQQASAADNVSW